MKTSIMKDPHKSTNQLSRRNFFKNAGIGAAAIAGMPVLASSCSTDSTENSSQKITDFFSEGDVVLFQGDSITDAGRDKKNEWANNGRSFGTGYAYNIASWMLEEMAAKNLTIYNRGISGNKVFQLADRWEKDCLELKPDVLSILIGVNDFWHMRNGRYDGTPEVYENDFRKLLNRTKDALPHIRLVICQPFVLTGTSAVDDSWLEPFRPYQESAAKIAGEFGATWVPFQTAFDKALAHAPAKYWAQDGVHPSMAGAQLMAETWLESLG